MLMTIIWMLKASVLVEEEHARISKQIWNQICEKNAFFFLQQN